ncbi:MAG: uracil-DNA glycosylase [Chitinophagaceae bacterium]|nr:uracil-DNA glycosylase [Oligoflexus sp.]
MSQTQLRLEESWKTVLADEFNKDYMHSLRGFLKDEIKAGKTIYPKGSEYFQALNSTPFDKVSVVILGQDPYHGPGQAHGLCFSVRPGVPVPPSLVNIYKELDSDLGIKPAHHGYLQSWADQGVLLLNNVLTVEAGQAGSHHGRGWEKFTSAIVEHLNLERENLVFMLWGSPAQKKGASVDEDRHLVLKAPHPSPLSAYRGFLGCHHFSLANAYLKTHGRAPIDWKLPSPTQARTIYAEEDGLQA